MVKICPAFRSTLLSWAMNTAATHWKMAAPSMFTVAPMGRMNLLILLSTPLFSSMHFIIDGRVAELEVNKTIQHESSPSRPGENHVSQSQEQAMDSILASFSSLELRLFFKVSSVAKGFCQAPLDSDMTSRVHLFHYSHRFSQEPHLASL